VKTVRVECRDIRLSYGPVEVLKDVNIEVEPGEFFALLGPSGCGKSSLLRTIAGFARQRSGQVLIDGRDVTPMQPWERGTGLVFQNFALWPHMTVWDNVAFGLVERRLDRGVIRERVGRALELVGLSALGGRKPNELSGGQQQRVALARTIVIEPAVLLLDEPLSNLDRRLRTQMRRELLALQRRVGITTIFVTHDQEEAMTTADRMAVLDQGVVQQIGTPAALYDYPANAFVASFVGTMNLLPARVSGRQARSMTLQLEGLGELEWAADADTPTAERLMLSFRPHSLCIDAADGARDPRYIWLPGIVEASEFLGEAMRYRVRVGGHSVCVDQPHRAGLSPHEAGSSIGLGLDRTQVRLLAH
jgi:iron(III) transport system ATP-binding protein